MRYQSRVSSGIRNPKSRRAVIQNIGVFEKQEPIKLFETLIQQHKDPSCFVEAEMATSIRKSGRHISDRNNIDSEKYCREIPLEMSQPDGQLMS
jgi:hypothetical protein